MNPPRSDADLAWCALRAHAVATLEGADRATSIRFVVDPADGTLITLIPAPLLTVSPQTLWVPDESFDATHAQVEVEPLHDPSGVLLDRHLMYHGRRDPGVGARLTIVGIKANTPQGWVIADADAARPNPLRDVEGRLCARLNADPEALARAIERMVGVRVDHPRAVGIDADGVDARARFGVLRLPFASPAPDESSAHAALAAMLAG